MRYRLSATIIGRLYLPTAALTSERDGIRFELEAGEDRRALKAAVSLAVPHEKLSAFRGALPRNSTGSPTASHLKIGGDKELRDRLLLALQEMESALANVESGHMIREIQWHEATDEFIAENPEEQKMLSVNSFTLSDSPDKKKFMLYEKAFAGMIAKSPRFEPLFVHRSIWREAMNAFEDGKHLYAILWFWFIIEDLFAAGHTGKTQVLKAFRSDVRFRHALSSALEGFKRADKNYPTVRTLFESRRHEYSVDGAAAFLFDIRGHLFHFSSRAADKISPHNQREFRPLALFFMHVVNLVLIFRIAELNRKAMGLPPERIPPA